MRRHLEARGSRPPPGSFIGAVVGLVFLGVGVTVIASLWGGSFGGFGSPPIFFRLVGSFIALAFVAVGGGAFFHWIRGARQQTFGSFHQVAGNAEAGTDSPQPAKGYACSRCGAPLTREADVSPSGDVKCEFCGCWFNIHQKDA